MTPTSVKSGLGVQRENPSPPVTGVPSQGLDAAPTLFRGGKGTWWGQSQNQV